MKLQPRHLIATPFLGFSAYLLIEFLRDAPTVFSKSWEHGLINLIFSGILIFVVTVPGVLAIKRRWEDFVKIIGFLTALFLFSFVSGHTSGLARTTENLIRADYPLLGALWGGCVVFAPFAVSIGAYKLFVPRIIRRIYRNITPEVSSFPPEPHASSRA